MSRHGFFAFLVCGGLAAVINMGSRWLFSLVAPYETAIVMAFCLGLLSGFILFKYFVFQSAGSNRTGRESFWYLVINLLALGQTLLVSVLLAKHFFPWAGMTFYPYDIAHVIGVGIPVITSYLGHKYLTFRK
jgi:Predicted membrane protein